jgi:predicted DNA-binding WGR domain protein
MALEKRYFELVEGTSSKFWEIRGEGNVVYTRYGRIGSDGQTTMKDQGSPDAAKKLYDKLVKEKTGKGYEEKGGGGGGSEEDGDDDRDDDDADDDEEEEAAPKKGKAAAGGAAKKGGGKAGTLAAVAAAKGKGLATALADHFAFLVETPDCKKLLARVVAKAKSAKVGDDGSLTVTLEDRFGDDQDLECSPPCTQSLAKASASEKRIYAIHDGMGMDTADVGVALHGYGGGGGFEQEYLEESEPELAEKAEEKGVSIDEVIQANQDWILQNPLKKSKSGEPTLHYFSHEGGGLGKPYAWGLGGVWLRVLAGEILDDDSAGLSAGDDDGEDDDDDGDEDEGEGDEGGGGARRFEFSEGSSNKFWEIRVEGSSHTVRYGKIGTDGQSKTKDFDSAAEARADAAKLIAEKTKKGYEET